MLNQKNQKTNKLPFGVGLFCSNSKLKITRVAVIRSLISLLSCAVVAFFKSALYQSGAL